MTTNRVDWLHAHEGVHVIDATADPRRVVEEIAECETAFPGSRKT
jgi:hypothetical protein